MLINKRFFSAFRTAARGMEAQRIAMGTATENIANATTSRTADGTPYAIKRAVHEYQGERYQKFSTLMNEMRTEMNVTDAQHLQGSTFGHSVAGGDLGPMTEVQEELRTRLVHDPTHPHANEDGYVELPDVNVVEEMARMISANRIYEANLSAVQATKEMIKRTLEI